MTQLNKILDIISISDNVATMSELTEQLDLSVAQISEALRPAIKTGDVIKTGKGKDASFKIFQSVADEAVSNWVDGITFTDEEMTMLAAFYQTSTDTCGACNAEENMSYMNANDLHETLGLSKQKISRLMKSLDDKGGICDTEESARGADINDWVITEPFAIRLADELAAIELEAKDQAMTTLLNICLQHDIVPMTARRKLRKAGIAKPNKQWSWALDFDITDIIALITK